jgi:hypothetical protein
VGPVRARIVAVLAVVLAAAAAVPMLASAGPGTIDRSATALRTAEPTTPLAADVVTVYNSGALRSDVANRAVAAARAAGGTAAIGRSASVGMRAVRRGPVVVQAPPLGFQYPMGTTVLPNDLVGRTMGRDVAANLTRTTLVMGQLTAGLRGARAGDTVDLVAASGASVTFRVAAVVPDATIGGTELLMSPDAADRLGISRLSRVVMWGFDSRAAINSAMRSRGLVSTSIRIRRSWDPPDPDSTIGMAQTKQRLGEFAYRVNANGSVTQDPAWQAANLPRGRVLLNPAIAIRARCHKAIEPAIRNALDEVAAAGLGSTINVYHANIAGGCHYPRFNRLTPNSSVGFLSRHSWGMAIDTNTVGSCQGCIPDFSTNPGGCTTVRIFRRHGFAWGGNFLTPDGMHFEWVGERRDQLPYPSRFCPNPGRLDTSAVDPADSQRSTLFADDGLYVGDHGDH